MVPVLDLPLLLKWNDPIQRSLVRGRGRSLQVISLSYFVVSEQGKTSSKMHMTLAKTLHVVL